MKIKDSIRVHEEGKINANMADKQSLIRTMFEKIRRAYAEIKKILDPENDVKPFYYNSD